MVLSIRSLKQNAMYKGSFNTGECSAADATNATAAPAGGFSFGAPDLRPAQLVAARLVVEDGRRVQRGPLLESMVSYVGGVR